MSGASESEFFGGRVRVIRGDSRDVVKTLSDNSVDALVMDGPYALVSIVKRFGKTGSAPAKSEGATGVYKRASAGFMGQHWDTGEVYFDAEFWCELYRVLKPGGHVAAFAGSRTYHRLACAIEDAGLEIRDSILDVVASSATAMAFMNSLTDAQRHAFAAMLEDAPFGGLAAWLYGSGFPKSHDVERSVAMSTCKKPGRHYANNLPRDRRPGDHVCQKTPQSEPHDGQGTALKPAFEPICLARKPLIGTVAENVLKFGTGAINVDGCRIEAADGDEPLKWETPRGGVWKTNTQAQAQAQALGRWPANVVHDGSDEVVASFPDSKGQQGDVRGTEPSGVTNGIYGEFSGRVCSPARNDSGSASRFFYTTKAGALDRFGSKHPTVKPIELMRWLVRLVTPPGGLVLDPFAGSGTTGAAAYAEGMRAILIEREESYFADIHARFEFMAGRGGYSADVIARHEKEPDEAVGGLFAMTEGLSHER